MDIGHAMSYVPTLFTNEADIEQAGESAKDSYIGRASSTRAFWIPHEFENISVRTSEESYRGAIEKFNAFFEGSKA